MTLSRFLIKSDYLERNGIFGAFFFPPFIVSAKSGMYTNCLSSHLHFFFFFSPVIIVMVFIRSVSLHSVDWEFPTGACLAKSNIISGQVYMRTGFSGSWW